MDRRFPNITIKSSEYSSNLLYDSSLKERDLDRTVGINTGHVGTSDFVLEPEDRAYVVEVRYK